MSLAALLDAFPECCVYDMVAPTLLDFAALDGPRPDGKEDPIMQARAVACLAAAWPRVPPSAAAPSVAAGGDKQEGSSQTKIEATTTATAATGAAATAAMETEVAFFARREAVRNVQRAHAEGLTRALSGAVQRKVWSVRVPIYQALAAVVGRSYTVPSVGGGGGGGGGDEQGAASSPPVLTGSLLSDVVHAVELGAEDAKYSQVRLFKFVSLSAWKHSWIVRYAPSPREVDGVRDTCLLRVCMYPHVSASVEMSLPPPPPPFFREKLLRRPKTITGSNSLP